MRSFTAVVVLYLRGLNDGDEMEGVNLCVCFSGAQGNEWGDTAGSNELVVGNANILLALRYNSSNCTTKCIRIEISIFCY